MAQVLKAVGDAVGGAVSQIQEVTGLGKEDKSPKEQQDVQQEVDQSPAGADEESSPEFTTTSKETEPSGEEVLKTTQDDVPLPQDDQEEEQEEEEEEAEPATQADTTPAAPPATSKPQPSPPAESSTPSPSAEPIVNGPMNQLRNMGGGSKPMPRTSKKWKQDSTSWYPDAGGVHHPPGFFIHKRRNPALA